MEHYFHYLRQAYLCYADPYLEDGYFMARNYTVERVQDTRNSYMQELAAILGFSKSKFPGMAEIQSDHQSLNLDNSMDFLKIGINVSFDLFLVLPMAKAR